MTAAALERGYRRWLRWYPQAFRREHEAEILGVLLAGARAGQRQPELMECLDLLRRALRRRLRPRGPRSARSVVTAVKLLYLGAVVELAAALTIVATIGDVRATVVTRNPGLNKESGSQRGPVARRRRRPPGTDRGHGWSRGRVLAVDGLGAWPRTALGADRLCALLRPEHVGPAPWAGGGSAVYARPDLAIGSVLWLVELAALALLFRVKMAVSEVGARRRTPGG